jgi:hypothetical protein
VSFRAETGSESEPNLQVLWDVVMGYYDRRTSTRVPGMLERIETLIAMVEKRDTWLRIGVAALIIPALHSLGVPTDLLIRGLFSLFGIHLPQ